MNRRIRRLIMTLAAIVVPVMPIAAIIPEGAAAQTILYVNQASGPYRSINAALNAAATGSVIEITDSANYYEKIDISVSGRNISNLTIRGREGEQPVISGEGQAGNVISLHTPSNKLQNLTVYVGGAYAGVDCRSDGNVIERVSFDNHIPAPSGGTFCVVLWNSATVTRCNFLGNPSVAGGGILANTSVPASIAVSYCDFYGTGTVGGMIGFGMAPGSEASVTYSVFYTDSADDSIIAINNWGFGSITEFINTFRNIDGKVVGFNNNTLHSTDTATTGTIHPQNSGAAMTNQILDNYLLWLGAPNSYSFSAPSDATLRNTLSKAIRWGYYDMHGPDVYDSVLGISLRQNTLDFMKNTKPSIWFNFSISWARQFDPSVWKNIKDRAEEVRSQPGLSDIILQGYCMEAIGRSEINNTFMDHDLWLFAARNFPEISFRPLVAKSVNGRRWQGHWFNYDNMLGYGVNHWDMDASVPNLNKQEALLYYIYLIKGFIDAGLNDISFGQPQMTFGQAREQYHYGGESLQYVSRFAKAYGSAFARPTNGQRYVVCGLATSYWHLMSYANYFDYTRGPIGVSDSRGYGTSWNSLADFYTTAPPQNIAINNKPYIAELDNYGENDHISTFAKASPAERNAWLPQVTAWMRQNRSFYVVQPGMQPLTPVGCQNFAGYQTPPQGTAPNWIYPFAWDFMPFEEYGGAESLIAGLFA